MLAVFRERGPRLANLGYFGHMWELYAVWTWLPAGFLLTVVTIQATPLVAERAGWPVAVALLAIGPAAGAVAMLALDRHMAARV